MNNLLLTKEQIKRAKRLRLAQLAATKNGMLITYRLTVFEERQMQASEEVATMNS
jgi:hypothetical protein